VPDLVTEVGFDQSITWLGTQQPAVRLVAVRNR
jgi:hypothetical protein